MKSKDISMNILLLDRYITERVIQLRKEKKVKISKLAEILNTEESFIRKIEAYANKYNIHHLFLLASYFKVSISEFFPSKDNFKEIKYSEEYKSFEEIYNVMKTEIEIKRNKGDK